jgi:hypothetical protein
MMTRLERNRQLQALYAKKELLVFMDGRQGFVDAANKIWYSYFKGKRLPFKVNDEAHDTMLFIHVYCSRKQWELENNYADEFEVA